MLGNDWRSSLEKRILPSELELFIDVLTSNELSRSLYDWYYFVTPTSSCKFPRYWMVAWELSWWRSGELSPFSWFWRRRAAILSLLRRSFGPSRPFLTVRFSMGRYSLGIVKLAFGLLLGKGLRILSNFCFSKSVRNLALTSSNSPFHRLCWRLKIWDHSSSLSSESDFFKELLRLGSGIVSL